MNALVPSLRQLRVLQHIVLCGSVSGAARAMHLSQPAVTQAIRRLEWLFGTALFHRSAQGMMPTAAGTILAHRVERCLAQLRDGCTVADALSAITGGQLRALIAVTEQGSMSAAARSLGVARPTAHRTLRELEGVLGSTLFEQTSHGLRATRDAGRLARHAQLAFAEIDQARAEIAAIGGMDTGRTVIGAMPLGRSRLVPAAVLAFAARCPGHTVSILDGPYEAALHELRHGRCDLMISALRTPAPYEDIVQEPLFEDPLALIVRAAHPLTQRGRPTLGDLSACAWVAPRAGSPLRGQYEALMAALQASTATPVPAAIECNSTVAARALLVASDRVMLLSANQVHFELEAGQLVALPHPLGPVSRTIGLTRRRDWVPTATQQVLVDVLREQVRISVC